jgi:hypothetical protein
MAPAAQKLPKERPMRIGFAAVLASLCATAPAQLSQVRFGGLPTNLFADFARAPLVAGSVPDEFFVLAPFPGNPATQFQFGMFLWDSHPGMQLVYPGGWYEVQFHFVQWAYLSTAPCGLQPAPGQTIPHGGIDSTYDYGPPLYTGPVLGVNAPLPRWVLGNVAVPLLRGNPSTLAFETFALFLEDYFHAPLNACIGGTPVTWVAVQIRFNLVRH